MGWSELVSVPGWTSPSSSRDSVVSNRHLWKPRHLSPLTFHRIFQDLISVLTEAKQKVSQQLRELAEGRGGRGGHGYGRY